MDTGQSRANTCDTLVLTIDVGLSAVKAALLRPDGTVAALREIRNDAVMHEGVCSEMDLSRLWKLVCSGISDVLGTDARSGSIVGISLSAAGNGAYLVAPSGEGILGITSMDGRAASIVASWAASSLGGRILDTTANHLWAGQPLPILAYLKQQGQLPDDARLLFCKDWLRHRLTGTFATDRSDASAAGLLDPRTGEWADDIIDAVGLAQLLPGLPDLVDSGEQTGGVTLAAAEQTGLPEGTPVFGGGIDLALGAMADGLDAPDVLHVTAGTWSINQQLCHPGSDVDMQEFLQAIIAPDGVSHTLVESSPTSAINLDVLAAVAGGGELALDQWDAWAETTRLEADDPIYLPYPSGAWDLPARTAEYRQLRAGLRPELVVAAVYDGIVLGHLRQIRKFQRRGTLRKLVACGGLTRSAAWCQRFADYADLPLEVSDNPHSTSWGAALCAFRGLGIRAQEPARELRTYTPDPARVCAERFRRFSSWLEEA